MKILYVITKSNWGGAQRYLYDLVSSLPHDQYEPVVALGGTGERGAAPGLLKGRLEALGVRVLDVTGFMRNMALWSDIRAFFELVSIIRSQRPDVLHVTSSKAGGLGALAGRLLSVPRIVFTSHGLTYDESWRSPLSRFAIMAFTWLTMVLAHTSIMISTETYERARTLPGMRRKVVLVRNGIANSVSKPRDEARTALVVHDPTLLGVTGEPWVGMVAELHPNKRHELILEALVRLVQSGSRAHLVLIGDGERKDELMLRARELGLATVVHFLGAVPDAGALMAAFDIFALTSRKEGLPYVLLEAGAAGVPTVACDIGGVRDIVQNRATGLLVPPHAEDVAHALQTLLGSPEQARAMGRAAALYVHEHFSVEQMVTQTTKAYSPQGFRAPDPALRALLCESSGSSRARYLSQGTPS